MQNKKYISDKMRQTVNLYYNSPGNIFQGIFTFYTISGNKNSISLVLRRKAAILGEYVITLG